MDPTDISKAALQKIRDLARIGEFAAATDTATDLIARLAVDEDAAGSHGIALALVERARARRLLGDVAGGGEDATAALERFALVNAAPEALAAAHVELAEHQGHIGRHKEAIREWSRAIACHEAAKNPRIMEIAAISNNLAFLHRADGDFDGAETHFLRALEIFYENSGPNDPNTVTVASSVGALYQAAGLPEQAHEFLTMALDGNRALHGEGHPDTAATHHDLAVAFRTSGNRSWARRHYEKALGAYEELGAEYHQELREIADAYCQLLSEDGEAALAEKIDQRVGDAIGTHA